MNIQTKGPPIPRLLLLLLLAAVLIGVAPSLSAADYISTTDKYAWTENAGWTNFRPLYGGVTVNPNYLRGYAWHQNLGWLKLGANGSGPYLNTTATNWGVNRDIAGNLSGYAWSEGWGWGKFNPTSGGVKIDPTSTVFNGSAWAENFGWVSFQNSTGAPVPYRVALASTNSNISTTAKLAWAENAGWVNLRPLHGGVTVNPNYLTGYAWHENLGWLKLGSETGGPYLNTSPSNWGVNRDQVGNLWGYAWSEGWGWVKFNPTGGGVSIDPASGAFSGTAWAENFGWISFQNQPGAPITYGVGLASYTLKLLFSGNGGGSVTSANPPFSCNTDCSKTFLDITPLTLSAAALQYALHDSWTGCDTVTGADCGLTLDRDRTTTVTFTKDTSHTARIDGATPTYYLTLQAAYDHAVAGNAIQVWGIDLSEMLVCGNSIQVRILGGYDQQYQNRSGATSVRGLIIGKGTVTVDSLVIR